MHKTQTLTSLAECYLLSLSKEPAVAFTDSLFSSVLCSTESRHQSHFLEFILLFLVQFLKVEA